MTPESPRYCRHCGRELRASTRVQHYDPIRGKPVLMHVKKCPRIRWWNPASDVYHDTWIETADSAKYYTAWEP